MLNIGSMVALGWHELLFRPLYNILIFLYFFLYRQMGASIIALVVVIRIILLPFSIRQGKANKRLADLQPDLEALNKRYSHDLEKKKKETKRLLQENRIGIWASVLSIFFQLLILAVLYSIFSNAILLDNKVELYAFVQQTLAKFHFSYKYINYDFFGWFSLILPNVWASAIAALIVFLNQAVRPSRGINSLTSLEKWMVFALPLFTFVVTMVLPSSKAVFVGVSVLISFLLGLFRAAIKRTKKKQPA